MNWKIDRHSSLKIFEHENTVLCTYQLKFVLQLQKLWSFFLFFRNFRKHLALIHTKAFFFFFFFFVLYAVIPFYFNEFINKIMKWNIANIKNYNYEVLNLQVHLTRLALTHEKKEKMIFTRRMPFFLLLPPENKFLQKVWTINAQVNE